MRWFLLVVYLIPIALYAQPAYYETIEKHRQTYKAEFLESGNSPLRTKEAISLIRFFAPDSTYRVVATVQRTQNALPFSMPTYNGQSSEQVAYANLSFRLQGKAHTLTIYRSLALANNPRYRDYLFLPFKDGTTGKETYGGGRYLDLRTRDIQNGQLIIDFNKAYNPYCAYGEGYSCPIPPATNTLSIAVSAGEKTYVKSHE
ncbi:MAG TPA: DUF1684 domain-containing protein [Fibrella sp.]|jgi:hypothetical protein